MSVAAPAADAAQPLRGVGLGLAAVALALGTFMQVLDTTIANVSLPTIAGNIGVSTDSATWIITSFAVANGVSVPISGWLMGRYGLVRTFVCSVLLFTVASFLCGIAWNLSSLVIFRVLQGAVSGPMIPGSQALLIAIFPSAKRGTALGIWSVTSLVAPLMGPVVGGYISDNFHWSWIFLINIPVGLFSGVVTWQVLSSRDTPTRKLPIDGIGLALLVVWVGSLQVLLDLGKNADWFNSPSITFLAVVVAVAFVAWLIWELTAEHPIVDLSLFKRRSFTIGVIALSVGYGALIAAQLILPLWLQTQVGYTATWAGLVSLPAGVIAVMLTPFIARAGGKVDARILGTVAFLGYAVSYYQRTFYTPDSSLFAFMVPLAMQGFATSMFFLAMLTVVLDGVPPERVPAATSLSNFVRIISSGFAISMSSYGWDRWETFHQSRLSENATAYSPSFQALQAQLGGLGLNTVQSTAVMTRQLVGQAYLLATLDIFWFCAIAMLVVSGMLWITGRPRRSDTPIAMD